MPESRERSKPVFGQCFDCGAIAWELLTGQSAYCMGCDPSAYRPEYEDEDDEDFESPESSRA